MVSEKIFFHYKSMGANNPRGVASLDPRGLTGRIYVGDHQTLLYTKYISSGPHVSEKFFPSQVYGSSRPLGSGQSGPQGLDWHDLWRGPLNITTYKIYKPRPHGFREDFLSFSHYKFMRAISWHGGPLDLRTMTIFTNFQPSFNTRLHL